MSRVRLAALNALASLLVAGLAVAAVPTTVVIDGVLTSTGGGPVADGNYKITFSLYKDQSGGTAFWFEDIAAVPLKGGQLTVGLGATKAIDPAVLTGVSSAWLGIKVDPDAELPRQAVRSVLFAVRAAEAERLVCSGCVDGTILKDDAILAKHVSFPYAGSTTKGGSATKALDLECTGCVSVVEMKFDGNVDLGANSLATTGTITATTYKGSGKDLTDIPKPTGKCAAGQAVVEIDATGKLVCAAALDPANLPKDGIDEISNGLVANQFQDKTSMTTAVKIPDYNPAGICSTLDFPDIGLAQAFTVRLNVSGISSAAKLRAILYRPSDKGGTEPDCKDPVDLLPVDKTDLAGSTYTLCNPCGLDSVKSFAYEYYLKDKPKRGDMAQELNKNPKGKWTLRVFDDGYNGGGTSTDGQIDSWEIQIQTLSSKKVMIAGDLIVEGSSNPQLMPDALTVKGTALFDKNVAIGGVLSIGGVPYSQLIFPPGSRPFLFGFFQDGTQNNWVWYERTKINQPSDVPVDNPSLHTVADEIRWGSKTGNLVISNPTPAYADSDDDSQQVMVAFVKNTTNVAINHNVSFYWSARDSSRRAGIAINKNLVWDTTSNDINTKTVTLTFPAKETSVVMLKSGSYYWTGGSNYYAHRNVVGYYNNSWSLPTGLEWDYDRYVGWLANK